MKRLVGIMMAVWGLTGQPSLATAQSGDWVFGRGGQMSLMLSTPLSSCNDTRVQTLLEQFAEGCTSTDNWDGYTGYWNIQDGVLCLDSIQLARGMTIYPGLMSEFESYRQGGRVVASWVSDTLRIVRGDVLYYEHAGFLRFYEHEDFLPVSNGRVGEAVSYDQRAVFPMKPEGEQTRLMHSLTTRLSQKMQKNFPQASRGRYFISHVCYTGTDLTHPVGVTLDIVHPDESTLDAELVSFIKKEVGRFFLRHHIVPLYIIKGTPWMPAYIYPLVL